MSNEEGAHIVGSAVAFVGSLSFPALWVDHVQLVKAHQTAVRTPFN